MSGSSTDDRVVLTVEQGSGVEGDMDAFTASSHVDGTEVSPVDMTILEGRGR
jgi:hypothetical protein